MAFGIPFQTRSPDRDRKTTQARLSSVEAAIAAAITAAERERDGLQRRIEAYYSTASFILDSSGDYNVRDAEDEEAIRQAERNALAGRQRLAQVETEISTLQTLQNQLRSTLDESSSPRAEG